MNTYNDVTPLAPRIISVSQKFIETSAGLLERKQGQSDVLLAVIEELNRTKLTAQEMLSREESIMVNPRLSSVGRREEMAALTKEYQPRFSFVREGATNRKKAAEQLRQRFAAVSAPVDQDPMLDFLRCKEVRERLAPLTMIERMKIVRQAMTNGDTSILRAIETDPLRAIITEAEAEHINRLKDERAQGIENGKAWLRLESLEFAAERLQQLATVIDTQLAHYDELPSFIGKPTRETDLAYTDTQAPPPKGPADAPTREQFQ